MPAPLVADPLGPSLSAMPSRWLANKTWVMQKGPGCYQAFVLGHLDATCVDKESAKAACGAVLAVRQSFTDQTAYRWERHDQGGDGLDVWTLEVVES